MWTVGRPAPRHLSGLGVNVLFVGGHTGVGNFSVFLRMEMEPPVSLSGRTDL